MYTLLPLPGRACSLIHDMIFLPFSILHRCFILVYRCKIHVVSKLIDIRYCTYLLVIRVFVYHDVVARVLDRLPVHICFSNSVRQTLIFAFVLIR